MQTKIQTTLIGIMVLTIILFGWNLLKNKPIDVPIKSTLKGIVSSQEYLATTTRNASGIALADGTLLKNGFGSVGEVTIFGAAAGTIFLCDATTTNVTLRNNQATSSLICPVLLPNSAAAGTYVINAVFNKGILFLTTGTLGTTSINWR